MTHPTLEFEDLIEIRGILYPKGTTFRQIIVTGPPGSGKSMHVKQLRGWYQEGYLDLASSSWWRNPILTFRPREVHLGFPLEGHEESLAVFDQEWLDKLAGLDFSRVRLPPPKKYFFHTDWRGKYLFDFLIPPPELIFERCKARAEAGTHPGDATLTLEQVRQQVSAHLAIARFMHEGGLKVILRETSEAPPKCYRGG